jgi:hypothetical protein
VRGANAGVEGGCGVWVWTVWRGSVVAQTPEVESPQVRGYIGSVRLWPGAQLRQIMLSYPGPLRRTIQRHRLCHLCV